MKYRIAVLVAMLMLILTSSAWAGWVIQEATDENQTIIYFHNNQIRVEDEGMVQIFDLQNNMLCMLNPASNVYWQGSTSEIKKSMQSAMEEALKDVPKEQREAAMKMMRADAQASGDGLDIKVRKSNETETIAGFKAHKHEIMVNGELKEELWLAPEINLFNEVDFQKLGKIMEAFNIGEPDTAYEFAPKIMKLYKTGYPVKRVTYQDGDTMVEQVVKAEKKSLSDGLFKLPAGFKKASFQEVMMPE